MPIALQTATFRDARGFTATTRFFVTGADSAGLATAAQAVLTPMAALSTLAFQSSHGPDSTPPNEALYPTPATYSDVEDKAVFVFQTAAGGFHRYRIPGPKSAIFLADGRTVDPANALVVAYAAAVIANVVDADGNAVAFGPTGSRTRSRTKRKLGSLTKNPQLTTPDV